MKVSFVRYPPKEYTCYCCGRTFPASPAWQEVQKHPEKATMPCLLFSVPEAERVCAECVILNCLKDNGTAGQYNPGEFNERTMANCNRKRRRVIRWYKAKGYTWEQLLVSICGLKIEAEDKPGSAAGGPVDVQQPNLKP